MRNKKVLSLIAVAIVTIMVAISGFTALGLNQPAKKTAFNPPAVNKVEHRTGSLVRKAHSAVYKFNVRDFERKKVRPLWNGKHPKVIPTPQTNGDKTV